VHRLRSVGRWMGVLLAVVVGAIAGLAALLGTAVAAPAPPVFLGVGLVAFVAATAGGVGLVTRGLGRQRRRGVRAGVTAAATLLVVAGLVVALLPLHDRAIPPAPVPGQAFWELPTGSRIAYVKVPAVGPRRPAPIVFLHGGPGVADMAGDAAYFGQLARDGYDVWVYDQVGVGRSARLHDPTGYSVGRDAADLEAIRQRIGAQRLILIGTLLTTPAPTRAVAAHLPSAYLDRLLEGFEQAGQAVLPRSRRGAALPGLVAALSARELEVLGLLAAGKPNPAIAQELVITLDTVKRHVTHILDKLGVANRVQAVTRARELGLLR
jgi:DNA-binding CsgD family transcriptional regulator